VPKKAGETRNPNDIPDDERDYFLERRYPAFGNMVPRDVASRAAKERCDAGFGVGGTGLSVYLDFRDSIRRDGLDAIKARYSNLFEMYERITAEDAYHVPMRIYPAVHYTMGGLWVDYELGSTVPGLFVLGEANFSDHGANRLGASALMQGLADGYFVVPYTVPHYLASTKLAAVNVADAAFQQTAAEAKARVNRILSVLGKRSVNDIHRELGHIMWDHCGMARNAAGLQKAVGQIRDLRAEFWKTINVPGSGEAFNQNLEYAGRLADFLEFGELLAKDALHRNESCGGHFREEYQTGEGETKRDDENFCYAAAWEYQGDDAEPVLHKEPLKFEYAHLVQRSYK
jgi:succinate dehydrogenase / fumarate reductase flavoprotein subunit